MDGDSGYDLSDPKSPDYHDRMSDAYDNRDKTDSLASERTAITPEVAYSIATGRAFAPFGEIQQAAEELLGRPMFTHEFASVDIWDRMRKAFEEQATEKYNKTMNSRSL